ncbi:MAG: histidine kinase [Microbacterium sp.]|jgi:signal transduction histidine kinase|nr:histidine kinase [Microbacterium sp.]
MSTLAAAAPPRTAWGVVWRAGLALALSAIVWGSLATTIPADLASFPRFWFWVVDPLLGIATLIAVLVSARRAPVVTGLATAVAVLLSAVAVGPALWALGSLATRRRWREIVFIGIADVAALLFIGLPYQSGDEMLPWWGRAIVMALGVGVVIATAIGMGQRRALLDGLRERAEQAEREQAIREEAVKSEERNRIAHDMHDVLAHRISLVAMHASALTFREDIPRAEQHAALQTIAENARLALGELRDVLGVLREPPDAAGSAPAPPQQTLADVPALVDEARAAGMAVDLIEAVDGTPPSAVSQAAYRVVREALTNARKHARDAPVTVSIAGEDGEGIAIRVRNAASEHPSDLPGAGLGLIAMRERIERTGGRMGHGTTSDGGYELTAWLPWAT